MKKFLTLLLAAVMLMTVALPLSSCSPAARLNRMDEPDRAVKLFEMSNQKADTASSFTMEQTMTMKMDIAGTTYDQKGVAKLTAIINSYPNTFAIIDPVSEVMGNFKKFDNSGNPEKKILDSADGKAV